MVNILWDESHALRKAFGHKVPKCPRQNHLGAPTVERAPAAMRQQGGHLWTCYICYCGTGGTHAFKWLQHCNTHSDHSDFEDF